MKPTEITMTLQELCEALQSGKIRMRPPLSELSADQQRRIKRIWDECAHFWDAYQCYEEFEVTFCRNVVPENEIVIWEDIVEQFLGRRRTVKEPAKLIDRLVLDSLRAS